MNSFYSESELPDLGLKHYGKNVLISRKVSIYGASDISIEDNVRIDDFCILSGSITLGSHIHISAYCALYASKGIIMEDYTGISPRCSLFSAMDDFSGKYLIGPIHLSEFTNVKGGPIKIEKYSQIGASSIVFPSITIARGCIVGAMSLVNTSLMPNGIYAGVPAKRIKERLNFKSNICNMLNDNLLTGGG